MGVDTHLFISNRFSVEDVETILKCRLACQDVKVNHSHTPEMSTITFKMGGNHRNMFVHYRYHLPTGPVLLLSLGFNDQAVMIMRTIAENIGGILEENDCVGTMESINGHLSDEDGLQYFLKWSVINNKLPDNTIRELNQAIHDWYDSFEKGKPDDGKYNLYPKN